MKTKNIILSAFVIALVGGGAYYGLSRKEIADRVIVKLSGMPRIHDFKDGKLFFALDVVITNPSDSGFTLTRPFVLCEFTDWMGNAVIAHTDVAENKVYKIAANSEQVIENVMIGLPMGLSPSVILPLIGGLIPAVAKSLEAFMKPLDMKMTIRTKFDGFFNIEIKEKYSFDVQQLGSMLRSAVTKKTAIAPTNTTKPSGVSGLYGGNYELAIRNYEVQKVLSF
jgi:hypothetical protein